MNGKSVHSMVPLVPDVRAVQDEWGMFDPNQAGLEAAFRAVRALDTPEIDDSMLEPVRSDEPALTLPELAARVQVPAAAPDPIVPPDLALPDDRDDLLAEPPIRGRSKSEERGAVYSLEFPTRCSQCCSEISTVRVSRLLRTQVSFTSTLPRKGYIIVCPECDGILSAELSGLL